MKHFTYTLAGDECDIFVPERSEDLSAFRSFLARGDKVLGLDSETSGLDIFSPGFRLRAVQFGNATEAWVINAERFPDAICDALRQPRQFAVHNYPFDGLVFDRHLGVRVEELADRVHDTRIAAHLLDSRRESEGGAGLSLKPLSYVYISEDAPDGQTALHARFHELGWTNETGWANIPFDDETYLIYAGLDTLLETRLFYALSEIVTGAGLGRLYTFESLLQSYLMILQRKGMRLDLDYLGPLDTDLSEEAAHYREVARRYGVENMNSTRQVADALLAMGETLTEHTKTGYKVDREVLLPLADLNNLWERREARKPNPLADAVLRGKRASKWRTSYVDAFRRLADSEGRLHASIGALQARTARMSVSRPPLQQLPSSDWKIRRAIVADPGQLMISSDYDQIELRVLAALADVKGMKQAIVDGVDLHGYTAGLVYGDDYTPKQRKLMKGVGFGKVYGGGAATLSRQTGADIEDVKRAVREYDRVYPEVRKYGRMLQRKAEFGKREVVTVSGRHLPLDRDRLYSATNYVIQSTSRDILAQAIVDLFDAGLGDYLLLPIHDELIAQAPEADAAEIAHEITRIMTTDFRGVPLTATAEVTGRNWGAAYGADPEAGL